MKTLNRINFIDIARGISIIFIVLGHIFVHSAHCSYLFKFLYSFHVVLFFVISGFVFNESSNNYFSFIYKKIKRILVPYFIWSLIFLIPFSFFGKDVSSSIGIEFNNSIIQSLKNIIYGSGANSALRQNSSLWFLPALFSIEIVYYLIIRTIKKYNMNYYIPLFFLIILSFIKYYFFNFTLPFGLNTCLEIGFFFYIGYILRKNNYFEKNNSIFLIIILFAIGIVAAFANNIVSCIEYEYGNLTLTIISGITLSLVVIAISYRISHCYILEYIGKNSLGILCFHKIIVIIFQTKVGFLSQLLNDSNIYCEVFLAIIVAVISIFTSLLINEFLKLFFPISIGEKKELIYSE